MSEFCRIGPHSCKILRGLSGFDSAHSGRFSSHCYLTAGSQNIVCVRVQSPKQPAIGKLWLCEHISHGYEITCLL